MCLSFCVNNTNLQRQLKNIIRLNGEGQTGKDILHNSIGKEMGRIQGLLSLGPK